MSFNRIAQGRQQQQQQQQQGSDGASLARRIQHNAELFRVRDDNSHSESSAEESEDGYIDDGDDSCQHLHHSGNID